MRSAWLVAAACALLLTGCAREAEPFGAEVRVDFDRSGPTRVLAHGWADRESGRKVTAEDPVRIASISKLVLAIGLMRLVEQGQLDLDGDVSAYLGWSLRHPAHPDTPISLRLLMSHRSGLTDEGGYVSHAASRTRELVENPAAWNADYGPGEWFQYTNLNFVVVAAIMERVTGERFDRLMDRLVLDPLGIDACYNWASCSDQAIARAVVIYRASGEVGVDALGGQRPACPVVAAPDSSCDLDSWRPGENGGLFGPQGGLRISALDLAKIGRLLLGGGELDGVRLLTPESVDVMFQPVWEFNGVNGATYEAETGDPGGAFFCRYGLATQTLATQRPVCDDDGFGDGVERVGHGGDAYGLVSGLWIDRDSGTGVAFYITGGDLARKGQHSAFYAVEEDLLER